MKLIQTPHYQGYLLEDIEKELGAVGYPYFYTWWYGQTGAVHKGKSLVYRHDWEQWLAGRPALD